MNFNKLIKKEINFNILNKKIRGNIHFFNYNNHNFIIFLKNYDYQIIKIPTIFTNFLNIILKYKNNKNSNFYKVLKFNYKRFNLYNYYLSKIFKKYNLINDVKNYINDFLIDKELIEAFKTVKYHKNSDYMIDNLMKVTIYKDQQKIKLFKKNNYKNNIIIIIPDIYLINFINIIKYDNISLENFFHKLTTLNKNNLNRYYIYY